MKEINILLESSRWKKEKINTNWLLIYVLATILLLVSVINYILGTSGTSLIISTTAAGMLYYVLYTRAAGPLIFATLLLPVSALVANYHIIIGISTFFIILLISSIYFYRATSPLFLFGICVYLIGVFFTTLFQTPLVGSDEMQFFNLSTLPSIPGYLFSRVELVVEFVQGGNRPGVYETFPILYAPLFEAFNISSPRFIVIINVTFWIGNAVIFRELLISYANELPRSISPNIAATMLLLSPTAIYWTGTFAKDIISASLCMIAAYLFLRKRYLLFLFILGLATGIRVYSVAIISIYIATMIWSPLLLGIGLFVSVLFVLIYTGQIVPLFNSILIWGYFFVSPNPMNIENWLDPYLFPRLIEGLIYAIGLSVSGLIAVVNRKLQIQYLVLSVGILIYALVIVAVAYRYTVFVRGLHYGFGTAGDNILRRMVPILPLIAIWMSITINNISVPKVEFRY